MTTDVKRAAVLLAGLLAFGCASTPVSSPPVVPDFLGAADPKADLLLLGVFHFANPGRDTYKPVHTFDVMSPERQREVEEIVDLLAARFRPTKVAVEFPPSRQAKIDELYQQYLRGEYGLETNEVSQLGFRLARKMGHPRVYLVDAPARYLIPPPEYKDRIAALEARGDASDAKDGWTERYRRLYAHDDELKTKQPLRDHLLYINSPERIRQAHGHYVVDSFKYGKGFSAEDDGYFGPDSSTGWYNRNLRIFRNLQRLTESPEERVVFIVGSGHVPILRFLAQTSPEHDLVEVSDILRR